MTHAPEPACRFCGSPLHHVFADLGLSPLSNAFVSPGGLRQGEMHYPLKAWICDQCWLVQLEAFERREGIFNEEYAYFSSFSQSWLDHARRYAEMVTERFGLGPDSRVVEIASNDGYLLRNFVKAGIPCLGIEPSANTADEAKKYGVESRVCFFGRETAATLVAEGWAADLLLGNNVLAHVPDLNDFVGGLKIALKPGGVITMEFPHLLRLMQEVQFDTIYHEHFSYLSFSTVQRIFAKHGLALFDVQELPTHGGSLRIFAQHEGGPQPVTPAVAAMLEREAAAGLGGVEAYSGFEERIRTVKRDLLRFLIDAKEAGKVVVGYGAPAKGNTLLNYCGVRTDLIAYTVDASPHKQGHYLPGTRIPVYAPAKLRETKPDYVLILPWNLMGEITEQHAYVREWGGRFVRAIPELTVLD